MSAVAGIGSPMNPGFFVVIVLNLASLNTPVHRIYADIIIVIMFNSGFILFPSWYSSMAGANPKDTASDNESMFFPKSESFAWFSFLATHPSVQSNIMASITLSIMGNMERIPQIRQTDL